MATDEERLIVLLEARIRDYEKNLQKASKTTGREFGEMRRHSKHTALAMERDMTRATDRINVALASTSARIGQLGAAFGLGGLSAGVAAGALVQNIHRTTDQIAQMAAEADRAGVSFEAFQELQFAAEKSKVSVDALTDGLKEMQLRADEFIVTGKGPAAEAFARLGLGADELAEGLKEPDQLFETIIGRLQDLDRAAQIRIADEIFGGSGGEQFDQMLDRGVDSIREARREAHELGVVLEDELAEKAKRVNERFDEIAATLTGRTNVALTNLGDVAISLADGPLGDLYDVLTALDAKAKAVFGLLSNFSLNDDIADWLMNPGEGGPAAAAAERQALRNKLSDLRQQRGEMTPNAVDLGFDQSLDARIAELETKLRASYDSGPRSRGTILPKQTVNASDMDWAPDPLPGSSSSRESAQKEIDRQREAVRELIADLEHERDMIGETDIERAKSNALRRAGVEETSKQGQRISALVEQIYAEQQALDEHNRRMEEMNYLAREFVGGIVSDMRRGVSATEALGDAFGRLGERLLDMALDQSINALFGSLGGAGASSDPWAGMRKTTGGGGFGGSIGSAIGGVIGGLLGFADGTANTGGRRGEPRGIVHGQEAVIPLPDGGRVPVQIQAPASAPTGTSRLEIELSGDLVARILQEAEGQSLRISQKQVAKNNQARMKAYQGGGNPR